MLSVSHPLRIVLLAATLLGCGHDGCGASATGGRSAGVVGDEAENLANEAQYPADEAASRADAVQLPTRLPAGVADRLAQDIHVLAPAPGAFAGPRPLVVLLHPYGGRADRLLAAHGLADVAALEGWVVITPQGMIDSQGMPYWNASAACCDRERNAPDDVAYLRALIERAIAEHDIDRTRVWLVGSSNGAFMAYRIACEAADLVTGVVAISGVEASDDSGCDPAEPVSVVHIHGTADAIVRFEGDSVSPLDARPEGGYPGAFETAGRWARRNGCERDSAEVAGTPIGAGARFDWGSCARGTRVHLHRIDGAEHRLLPSDTIRDVTIGAISAWPREPES